AGSATTPPSPTRPAISRLTSALTRPVAFSATRSRYIVMAPAVRPGGRPMVQIVCRRLWTLVHLWPGFCRPQATLGPGRLPQARRQAAGQHTPRKNGVFAAAGWNVLMRHLAPRVDIRLIVRG